MHQDGGVANIQVQQEQLMTIIESQKRRVYQVKTNSAYTMNVLTMLPETKKTSLNFTESVIIGCNKINSPYPLSLDQATSGLL